MLDRNYIRNNPNLVKAGAEKKNVQAPIDEWIECDIEHRSTLRELESIRAELNSSAKKIGQLMAEGKKEEAENAKSATKELKEKQTDIEEKSKTLEEKVQQLELQIPNIPQSVVPEGTSEAENKVIKTWGEKPEITNAQAHWDIASNLGLLDMQRASKISGSGFALYTNWGAKLQRALINFLIEHQTNNRGYTEVYPPVLVRRECLVNTGSLPKFEGDFYELKDDDLYLIPTSEVPLTSLYANEIIPTNQLTMKMTAISSCFRREAGAAGKDTRGLQRLHQFDKVELFKYTKPEDSDEELDLLREDAESALEALGLHYRSLLLCGGEMGFSNVRQYDLEIWSPAMEKYLEISSCSNFGDFQARRANIRFRRDAASKPEFVHTLNGSGLATPRLFAVLIETYQNEDGSINVPKVLQPYLKTEIINPTNELVTN